MTEKPTPDLLHDGAVRAWFEAEPGRMARMELITELTRQVSVAWPWFRASPSWCELVGANAAALSRESFETLRWVDLALVEAFRAGQPEAATVMADVVAARLVEVLRNKGATASEADDLVQECLCTLLARADSMPYSGRGMLIGWLRTSVLRDLGKRRRSDARHAAGDVELSPPRTVDPESALVAHQYRPHLRAVMREVFTSFDQESRRILRLVHLGGLTANQVGVLFGMHRVTVQRRLRELRAALEQGIRKQLAARFGLDDGAIQAIVNAPQQTFDTTLSVLLATPNGDA